MVTALQFDDEGSRLVEGFNRTPGAVARRYQLLHALALSPEECALDVGSGPGHLALEMASAVDPAGQVYGLDSEVSRHEQSLLFS